ncbi:MAG: hypothetical protein F6K61_00085 [Sphaerospermopsis sp. SIO1G1]|nr:hypothetical protein [Sphaerospermopsis sp. SIO1G1]
MESINKTQYCANEQEFQKSLIELEDILQVNSSDNQNLTEVNESQTSDQTNSTYTEDIDLNTLEDAMTDIEQYLARRGK